MIQARTAFAAWPAGAARALLAGLAALILYGAIALQAPALPGAYSDDPETTDEALYGAVVARMQAGEGYYPAAVAEHRARHYPLRPFVTVRPPWLATMEAGIGLTASSILLKVLMVAALAAACLRVRQALPAGPPRLVGLVLAGTGMAFSGLPALTVWHEAWAALLIVLSLACRSDRRWAASVAFGLAAALIRELALPYLAVMLAFAAWEGRRREALAWSAALLAVVAALAWHAACLSSLVSASDTASPGWVAVGGWVLVLRMLDAAKVFGTLPTGLLAALAPLALLGWAAWPQPIGRRGAALLAGLMLAFTVVGRPNNLYWGILFGPLLSIGLAWAPQALADLARAARGLPATAAAAC